jgi:hypothetical protein
MAARTRRCRSPPSSRGLPIDPRGLQSLLPVTTHADLVFGRRVLRSDPFTRHIGAAAWNGLVRHLFGVPVDDVDCAFKLARSDLLEQLSANALRVAAIRGRLKAAKAADTDAHDQDVAVIRCVPSPLRPLRLRALSERGRPAWDELWERKSRLLLSSSALQRQARARAHCGLGRSAEAQVEILLLDVGAACGASLRWARAAGLDEYVQRATRAEGPLLL